MLFGIHLNHGLERTPNPLNVLSSEKIRQNDSTSCLLSERTLEEKVCALKLKCHPVVLFVCDTSTEG